jgi:hypothetical protein
MAVLILLVIDDVVGTRNTQHIAVIAIHFGIIRSTLLVAPVRLAFGARIFTSSVSCQ